ncbi:MAG: hypothetical protein ACQEVA_04825 [Myxococcota bacterium]
MTNSRHTIAIIAFALLLPATALAQSNQPEQPSEEASETEPKEAKEADKAAEAPEQAQSTVNVSVARVTGEDREGLADKAVVLSARRPKGPFEQKDPEAAREWTGITNATGVAEFSGVDTDTLVENGLRLDAQVEHGGMSYKSGQVMPANGATIEVDVFERSSDLDKLFVANLRTLVYVWEDYLGFQQVWTLSVRGDKALDTSLLKGEDFENGIPLTLPLKAEGIDVVAGALKSKTVNSTVFVSGVIKPGEAIPVRIDYSIPVTKTKYTYEQTLDYPAKNVDVGVMLDTGFQQYPRLRDLTLTAPGFEAVEPQRGFGRMFQQFGQRDFLIAKGAQIDAGDGFLVRMEGLPFEQPLGPWIALGLGFAGMIFVFGFGRAETKRMSGEKTEEEIAELLRQEKKDLMEELVALEEDYEEGYATQDEYERESMMLRERLALVMKKLRDLEPKKAA